MPAVYIAAGQPMPQLEPESLAAYIAAGGPMPQLEPESFLHKFASLL